MLPGSFGFALDEAMSEDSLAGCCTETGRASCTSVDESDDISGCILKLIVKAYTS
jgi:hypothetical protein